MAHTSHGSLVGFVNEEGTIDPTGIVLLDDVTTVAVGPMRINEPHEGGPPRKTDPVIALAVAGPVHGTDDTVSTVVLTGVEGATMLVAHVLDAIERSAGPLVYRKSLGTARRHVFHEARRRTQAARQS